MNWTQLHTCIYVWFILVCVSDIFSIELKSAVRSPTFHLVLQNTYSKRLYCRQAWSTMRWREMWRHADESDGLFRPSSSHCSLWGWRLASKGAHGKSCPKIQESYRKGKLWMDTRKPRKNLSKHCKYQGPMHAKCKDVWDFKFSCDDYCIYIWNVIIYSTTSVMYCIPIVMIFYIPSKWVWWLHYMKHQHLLGITFKPSTCRCYKCKDAENYVTKLTMYSEKHALIMQCTVTFSNLYNVCITL